MGICAYNIVAVQTLIMIMTTKEHPQWILLILYIVTVCLEVVRWIKSGSMLSPLQLILIVIWAYIFGFGYVFHSVSLIFSSVQASRLAKEILKIRSYNNKKSIVFKVIRNPADEKDIK